MTRGPADPRKATIGTVAGAGTAALGLLLAAVTGGPYLTSGDVNGWLILYALGLLGALVAAPFLIESLISSSRDDVEARWDIALPLWGAVAAPRSTAWRVSMLALCLVGQWWWICNMYALGNTFWRIP